MLFLKEIKKLKFRLGSNRNRKFFKLIKAQIGESKNFKTTFPYYPRIKIISFKWSVP